MEPQKFHMRISVGSSVVPRWGCVTSSGYLANSSTPAHQNKIVGITAGRIEPGAWGDVTSLGVLYDKDWNWTPGAPLYLNGSIISQVPPVVGFVQQVAWSITAQSLLAIITGPSGPAAPVLPVMLEGHGPPAAPPPDPSLITLYFDVDDGDQTYRWKPLLNSW